MLKLLIVLAAVVLFGLCVAGALAAAVVWMTRFAKRMATRVELVVQRVSNDVPMLKTLVHVLQTLLLGGFGSGISLFTSSSAQAYGQLLVGLIWMVAAAAAILKVERRIKELEDKSK